MYRHTNASSAAVQRPPGGAPARGTTRRTGSAAGSGERAGRGTARALAAALLFGLAACSEPGAPPAAVDSPHALERGAELLAPFRQQLMAALQEGLRESPEAAIRACRVEAPRIAERQRQAGVEMGRSSHRLRNPDNAPAPWMQDALDHYLAQPQVQTPRAVMLADGMVGYAEPILTQPQCLLCHGRELSPAVAERIAQLYPEDRATGFDAGDLRGIFWVTFPPDGNGD